MRLSLPARLPACLECGNLPPMLPGGPFSAAACVTLVESDDAGQKVANERYYTTA